MESELLPCPFCNFVPITDSADFDRGEKFRVICQSLKCNMSVYTQWCNSEGEAIKIWNTRTNKAEQALAELKAWLVARMIETVKNSWDDQRIAYEFTVNKIKELQGE